MESPQYIPGVCNIGPAEIARRRLTGWAGLVLTLVLGSVIMTLRPGGTWTLILLPFASLSAAGFLQQKMHFCAGFGLAGMFNFGTDVGKGDTVEQTEFRALDRKKAVQILGLSTAAGLLVTLTAFLFYHFVA